MGDITYGTLAFLLNCHFEFGDRGSSPITPLKPILDTESSRSIFTSSIEFLPDVSILCKLTRRILTMIIQVHHSSGFRWRSWRIFECCWAHFVLRQAVAPSQHTTLCL